jgi:signal transduction histidine kinase/CheY-like chemotaxis protein/HAMP domain-containing protein
MFDLFKFRSFRLKLLLTIWLSSSATLLMMCLFFIFLQMQQFDKDLEKSINTVSNFIAEKSTSAIMFNDVVIAEDALLSAISSEPAIIKAVVYGKNSSVIASYIDTTQGDLHIPIPQENSAFIKDSYLHTYSEIMMYSDRVGAVYIMASRAALYVRIRQFIFIATGAMLILFLFSMLLSILLQKPITTPIMSLISAAKDVSEKKDYSIRVKKEREDELGDLSDAFNDMLSQIQKSDTVLRDSKEGFEEMISNIPGVIYQFFATKNNKYGLSYVGSRAKDILGLDTDMDEFYDRFNQCIDEEYRDEYFDSIAKAIKNILPFDFTAKFIKPTGEEIFIHIISQPHMEGGILIANGVITDITEKRNIEEEHEEVIHQLNQSQKMEAVGQLSSGIAHDFNNMLAGIIGAAEIIKQSKYDFGKENEKFLEMIISTSGRAADLTAKLLAYGRKGEIMSTPLNLHEILKDCVDLLSRTIDKRIVIRSEFEAVNSTIVGNDSDLQNAFMNICINASHAMSEGGEIQLITRNVELDSIYCNASPFEIFPGNYVEIEIRDSGIGISEDHLEKIFEPFFTTKDQGEGTGLGLSAVYGTVKSHNGAITVYSQVGTGSVFHIFLACSSQVIKQELPISPITFGSGTIFLVDDEEIIRLTSSHMLKEMGYKVITAIDGIEAIEIFKENHQDIDLVISDMIMPKMNGSTLFYKMKDIDSECRMIISSGFTKEENISELKSAGLLGFINKPFRKVELAKLLSEVLPV